MKYFTAAISATLMLVSLSGCGKSGHDVAYYNQHPDERKQRYDECRNDAAEEETADCQNAIKSELDYRATGIPNKPEFSR
ncbi:EexN family lipoprotein [Carnimonas nigrificans]|uniref:EexN family lipoprotein n=1 Tax=Carnimonas nigrificans TaxID=64323 RepID=UPI0012EC131D|nr:EexN family lipoprotein [Carnimonas nigrificans]